MKKAHLRLRSSGEVRLDGHYKDFFYLIHNTMYLHLQLRVSNAKVDRKTFVIRARLWYIRFIVKSKWMSESSMFHPNLQLN